MPKVFPNNRYWLRSGNMNQKRHVDMTEEEKLNISTCQGIKEGHICKNPIFRCSKCGNYGCDQVSIEKCTEQGFKNGKCLHCGSTETRIPVMKDEFERYINEWDREVPTI
ncbi:MAG: hypothetical protein WC677_00460 [Clostridia bacterium]